MKSLIIVLLLTFFVYPQKVKVTFKVTSNDVKAKENIYIAGNHELLGNWTPNTILLEKKNGTYTKTIDFNIGDALEFKFTKGSWDKEALDDEGIVMQNMRLNVVNDTTIALKVKKWKSSSERKVRGQITGTVKYHKQMTGEGLLPRDIIVWLPKNYEKNKSQKYPVLYAHDGQNIFDPKTSSMGVDWQLDETVDSLIKANRIEEIIIVGINNTNDRFLDYSYGEKGTAYMNFIVNKLKPFIDKTYRTKSDRENTAVLGSSMGGLISLMVAWEHSDVFSKAACFSPAFKIQELDYAPYVQKENKKDIKLYIDNGGVGLEDQLQPGIDDVINILKEKGFVEGKDLMYIVDKEAEHNEAAWAKRAPSAIEFLFSK